MRRIPTFWIIGLLFIVGVVVVSLYYPVAFILQKAFFPVHGFSLEFFKIILTHKGMQAAMFNSLMLGVIVTVLCVMVSMPLSWISTRYVIKYQGLLNGLMMIPLILPPFVGAIGMKQFLSRFGTLNIILMQLGITDSPIDWLGSGFWGVVLLEVLHLFPIIYLNISAALANIDPSLEEAAWNLGSNKWSFIKKILLPLAAPGIFAGCAIVFVWAVTDLGTPLILEYRDVVAYQIYNMINDIYENPMGYALVVFVLIWVALVYFGSKTFFLGKGTQGTTRASRATSRPRLKGWYAIGATSLFLIVGGIALVPHFMIVLSSISERWFMTALPERFSLTYYGTAVNHPLTVLSVRNSLFLSSLTTIIDIFIGITAAYVLARFKFFGRQLLDFSVMLPLALPGLILAFGYVGAFAGTIVDPRTNPFPLLIAAYSIRRLPFMVRALDAGLRQVPVSMEEAALNLGASHGKTLIKITLPLVSSNVMAGGILVFSFAMLEVSDSLILAMKENYYPVTKAIYALISRVGDGFPLASTLGVLTMILLGVSMMITGKILGKKMGELFRM